MKMGITNITERCIRFSLKPLQRWDLYNYLLICDKNVYVIDTGCGLGDVEKITDYLKERQIDKPIIIINTHYHWDHIWGNKFINSKMIISSKKCFENICEYWDYMLDHNKEYINKQVEKCLPNRTFSDKINLLEDDLELKCLPGHTNDGIIIYDKKDKILFVGDNIGDDDENIIPDLESSLEEYLESINEFLLYDFDYVLSGHNQVKNRDFILKIKDEIIKQMKG